MASSIGTQYSYQRLASTIEQEVGEVLLALDANLRENRGCKDACVTLKKCYEKVFSNSKNTTLQETFQETEERQPFSSRILEVMNAREIESIYLQAAKEHEIVKKSGSLVNLS